VTENITVVPGVNLTVSKTANVTGNVVNGQTITYTIIVTNHGPDTATNVVINEILPSTLLFINSSSANYNNNTGVWAVGTLTNGQSATLIITVRVNGTGVIINGVNVTADQNNTNNDTNDTNVTENITVVLSSNSTIVVPVIVKVGKTISINGVASDEYGNSIANTNIKVTVDGKTYTVKTDKFGSWALPYKPTHTGNVVVSSNWQGNGTHNGFTNKTSFNVKKGNIIIVITVDEDDNSIIITGKVTDEDGDPIVDYPVDFELDGEKIGTKITDKNGIAKITIPKDKIADGKHTVTLIVDGKTNYENGTNTTTFTKEPNKNKKPSNNPATAKSVAMKKTGIPMVAIVLVLLSLLGVINRRKNK
jgi:uncharacterized repeat protein (TIGR01451 family)